MILAQTLECAGQRRVKVQRQTMGPKSVDISLAVNLKMKGCLQLVIDKYLFMVFVLRCLEYS